jgi:hypothetical protein
VAQDKSPAHVQFSTRHKSVIVFSFVKPLTKGNRFEICREVQQGYYFLFDFVKFILNENGQVLNVVV